MANEEDLSDRIDIGYGTIAPDASEAEEQEIEGIDQEKARGVWEKLQRGPRPDLSLEGARHKFYATRNLYDRELDDDGIIAGNQHFSIEIFPKSVDMAKSESLGSIDLIHDPHGNFRVVHEHTHYPEGGTVLKTDEANALLDEMLTSMLLKKDATTEATATIRRGLRGSMASETSASGNDAEKRTKVLQLLGERKVGFVEIPSGTTYPRDPRIVALTPQQKYAVVDCSEGASALNDIRDNFGYALYGERYHDFFQRGGVGRNPEVKIPAVYGSDTPAFRGSEKKQYDELIASCQRGIEKMIVF